MGATHDPELLQETFNFIKNKSRDQDIIYYFRGLSVNTKMRRALVAYFKDQYENVSALKITDYEDAEGRLACQTLRGQFHNAIPCFGSCSIAPPI